MRATSIIKNPVLNDKEKLEMLQEEGYQLYEIENMIFTYNSNVDLQYDEQNEVRW